MRPAFAVSDRVYRPPTAERCPHEWVPHRTNRGTAWSTGPLVSPFQCARWQSCARTPAASQSIGFYAPRFCSESKNIRFHIWLFWERKLTGLHFWDSIRFSHIKLIIAKLNCQTRYHPFCIVLDFPRIQIWVKILESVQNSAALPYPPRWAVLRDILASGREVYAWPKFDAIQLDHAHTSFPTNQIA